MRRVVAGIAIAAVAVVLAAVPAAGTGTANRPPISSATPLQPLTIALFNDPVNHPHVLRNFERHLVSAGQLSSLRGDEIRASFYHLSDRKLATELVAAARHGAVVQVLLDGSNRSLGCHGQPSCENPAFTVLEQLNTVGNPNVWLRTCDGIGPGASSPLPGATAGCIGERRNHNKFMLLESSTGLERGPAPGGGSIITSHDVVVQTSSNNTKSSYNSAYNNALVSANQPAVYADYVRYFGWLAQSYRATAPPSLTQFDSQFGYRVDTASIEQNDVATWSFPQLRGQDPFLSALDAVQAPAGCANSQTTAGSPATATVELAMSRIAGRVAVIERLAALQAAGCSVDVAYGSIGGHDAAILRAVGVGLHRVCLAPSNSSSANRYVHSKYLSVSGTVAGLGADVRVVYTGSENLNNAALSLTDDRLERYVELATSDPIYAAYDANFRSLVTAADTGTQATGQCIGDD